MEKTMDKPQAKGDRQISPSNSEYQDPQARQAVSQAFQAAEQQGPDSDQVLDNRTGYTRPEGYGELDVVQYGSAPGVRSSETADSGQYGEGGRYSEEKENAARHNNPVEGKADEARAAAERERD